MHTMAPWLSPRTEPCAHFSFQGFVDLLAASERFVSKPDTCVLGACLLGGGHSLLLMIGRSKSVQLTDDERKQWERSIKSLRKTVSSSPARERFAFGGGGTWLAKQRDLFFS